MQSEHSHCNETGCRCLNRCNQYGLNQNDPKQYFFNDQNDLLCYFNCLLSCFDSHYKNSLCGYIGVFMGGTLFFIKFSSIPVNHLFFEDRPIQEAETRKVDAFSSLSKMPLLNACLFSRNDRTLVNIDLGRKEEIRIFRGNFN